MIEPTEKHRKVAREWAAFYGVFHGEFLESTDLSKLEIERFAQGLAYADAQIVESLAKISDINTEKGCGILHAAQCVSRGDHW